MTVRADQWCCGLGVLYIHGTFGTTLNEMYSPESLSEKFYNEFGVMTSTGICLKYMLTVFMFSDEYARPHHNKGALVAKFITDNKLGAISQSIGMGLHGYNISVWTWVMDKGAMLNWLQAEYEKRKPRVTESSMSTSSGTPYFAVENMHTHTLTVGVPPNVTAADIQERERYYNASTFIRQKNAEYIRTRMKKPK